MSTLSRVSVESGRVKEKHPRSIRVERDGVLTYGTEVRVLGAGRFVTDVENPRPYGAFIWFETTEPVIICSEVYEAKEVE